MTRLFQRLIVVSSILLLSACASIQSGRTQQVKISSNPVGATVYVAVKIEKDGKAVILYKKAVGVTPLSVTLSRKDGTIFVEKEGYDSVEVALTKKMNPWVWGDILLGSLLSTSIDTSTGAAHEYDPGEYVVDLKPSAK
jgi:hypothetical protein